MKKNYKLKLFTALVVASLSLGTAEALTLTSTTIVADNSDNWVEIQNENGIKVLFTSYHLDGKSYLKIKFENQTNENIQFSWSLTNKDSEVLINNHKNEIIANKAFNFIDATMPISINNGETVNDFSINVNIK